MDILNIMAIIGSGLVFFFVIELIRRGRLKERYSLLWLFSSAVMILFSLSRNLLDAVAHLFGILYPPAFLFLLSFFFLILNTLHFSVVISDLSEKNKRLSQEITLLRQAMREQVSQQPEGGNG